MRILIIRTSPNQVNLSTYNLQEIGLAKALIRKGHYCDVMYYSGKEKDHIQTINFDENKKLNILWLHGFGLFREGIYPSLKKFVNDYDVIQVGGYVGLVSCWINRHCPGKAVNYQGPYFCRENRGDIGKAAIFDRVLLPLQHKKNMIVATKSVLATNYIKNKGIQDVTTVGVGLDLDNLVQDSVEISNPEFVQSLKELSKEKILLYIGVLEERRNIPFLLRVFKKVGDAIPSCRLVLIGNGKPEYVAMCMSMMDELDIRDKVIYKDKLEQKYLPAVYKLCDAFLLPTRYEIFGMVLLEAMYYKLPVFTTYNGGSSMLISEGNGIVINTLEPDIWSKNIVDILCDNERCLNIGEAAHRTIVEEYTWDVLADKFLEIYRKRVNQ